MVTIKQVAAHAGTSFKTVSRVINNEISVRPETREKVKQSIKALGYRPNVAARMMRNAKSGIIGFIADEVSTRPEANDIIKGAQELAWQHNKLLMVINVKPNNGSIQKAIDQLLEFRAEGVIYACMYHQPVTISDDLHNLPTVIVNGFSVQKKLPSVVPDDYSAAFELTTRMIKKGYKKIALLNLNRRIVAAGERQRGYFDAHSALDIHVDDAYVHNAVIEENGIEHSVIPAVIDELLALPEPPDAIVCGKDELAMELYVYLTNKGIIVGKDIHVGSFDNMHPIAKTLQLSTMGLPYLQMGEWGMRYLLDGCTHTDQVKFPCNFIERTSF